jgi:hypothetical protein
MVGEIAMLLLTPQAARQVAVLLARDRLADGRSSGRTTLGEIASWADEIKDHEWSRGTRSWHFDDVPVCGEVDRARYCRRGNCASVQLEQHIETLASARATRRQKNEALKWVVHLVGDLHQPLHAANRHDRGGNLVPVRYFGERENPPYGAMNLHAIWDIHLVQRLIAQRGGETAIVSLPFSDTERHRLDAGGIDDWVAESNRLAKQVVYAVLPHKLSCAGKDREVLEIDADYAERAMPVIEHQIRKAGLRLARILNQTLAPQEQGNSRLQDPAEPKQR